jgi:hypothetical protein
MDINAIIINDVGEYMESKIGKIFTQKDYDETLEKFLIILTVSEFWRTENNKE